jgi:hypothetical protein
MYVSAYNMRNATRFSQNFILVTFIKLCLDIPALVKTGE